MSDKEIVQKIMKLKKWKQADVARCLGVHRSKITRVMNEGETLHPSSRKLLEGILEEERQQ